MTLLERLRQELRELSAKMREMHKKAEDEDRGFDGDENTKWQELVQRHNDLSDRISRAEEVEKLDTIADQDTRSRLPAFDENGDPADEQRAEVSSPMEGRALPEYREAYEIYCRRGAGALTADQRALLVKYEADFSDSELRALATGTDAAGGFTIPEGFAGFITETMQDFSGLLQAASPAGNSGPTLLRTASGNLIPFPTNDDTGNAGSILAENAQVSEGDPVFGARNLTAYMYSSNLVRVSLQLLQDEAVNLEAYLGNLLGKRLGRAVSPHFAAGTGTGQPTGLSTAATDGGVNVSVAAGITYVDLLDFEHALDPAYRRRGAQWTFNDATLRLIKGILDGNSRPIWLPGDSGSLADNAAGPSLSGYGYIVDQGMDSLAVGDRPICFGDLSEFYIREVIGVVLFRFGERYMDFLQIGWMGYGRWDSNLIDTSAVVTDIAVA